MVMLRRGVRAVGERRQRETPQERGYRRLGAAVIVSAVRDLEKPTRAGGESVRAGESARAFLTVSNAHLKFWCCVADRHERDPADVWPRREGRANRRRCRT